MFKPSTLPHTLLLASGILLTVVVLFASETGNTRLRESYIDVIRSQRMQTALAALNGELVDAEGGQRGFLLTGKESYLDPYYKALPRIDELMGQLRAGYASDPEGLKLFTETSKLISSKLNEMALTMIYGKRDLEVALDLVRTDYGKQTMDNARRGLDRLQAREAATVSHRLEGTEHDVQLSRYGIGLLTAINIVLLVAVGMGHAKRLATSESARTEAEEEGVRLDRKVQARTRQLSALAGHLLRVSEDEKTRLARELHDEMGAILTAVKLDLHWVRRRVQDTHPEAAEKLTRVMHHVDQGIQIKRRLIEDLRPTVLINLGLREALNQLVEDVAARNHWQAEIRVPEDLPPLRQDAAIALFRIAQESLTNASKYSQARHIWLSLDCSQDGLTLTVRDDGKGLPPDFDPGNTAGHHGLIGMEQRVTALGGRMKIDSSPHAGVGIRVDVPLTASILAPAQEPESQL